MNFARNKILQRLRSALKTPSPIPYPEIEDREGIFPELDKKSPLDIELHFVDMLREQGGEFIYCESWRECRLILERLFVQKNWKHIACGNAKIRQIFEALGLEGINSDFAESHTEVGITSCEALIARSGSVLLSSAGGNGRSLSILPPVHIVLATSDQICLNLEEALEKVEQKRKIRPSMLSLVSGPSRTADIEKTLVLGAHGPKQLYVVLVEI